MIWDYRLKNKLFTQLCEKLECFREKSWMSRWDAKTKNSPVGDPSRWNEYLDELGCTRIVRDKLKGWDYEDDKTPQTRIPKSKSTWKSMNLPGYIHLSNPIWPGDYHKCDHVIRIPKDIAEKVMVLGSFP